MSEREHAFNIGEIGFSGLRSEEEIAELKGALDTLRRLYRDRYFIGDMLCTFGKICAFTRDAEFLRAVEQNLTWAGEGALMWRLHTLVWAARSAVNLSGDMVECGVFQGLSAAVVTACIEESMGDKTFYLYDTFEGLSDEYSSAWEQSISPKQLFAEEGLYEAVQGRFSGNPRVRLIKGVVPDVLERECPERICFLHIDMNAAAAEIGALEVLFDRVVTGGFIVFDDFGQTRLSDLHAAEAAWMKERGYHVLELPTGQGLVIKR